MLHGHSVAGTVLSMSAGSLRMEGYEVQKAFEGQTTHEAALDLPIVDNDQDIARLAGVVAPLLDATRPRNASRLPYTRRGPAALLLDIEGTTTPIAFVHDVLFPFARARLQALDRAADQAVAAELAAVREAAPDQDPLSALLGWMDVDAKATPLKALQGLIWREGYADGSLRGELYPDVPSALRAWRAEGRRLFVYSSGSIEAQRLIFAHSTAGDLSSLLDGHFDTRTGPKREQASYAAIAAATGYELGSILFLSDVAAELDAARGAGLATCQLVRERDRTVPCGRHPAAPDFDAVPGLVSSWGAGGPSGSSRAHQKWGSGLDGGSSDWTRCR